MGSPIEKCKIHTTKGVCRLKALSVLGTLMVLCYEQDLLCWDFDGLWAVDELCVFVSEPSTPGVNILCVKLVPKVLLQFELAGTQDSVCVCVWMKTRYTVIDCCVGRRECVVRKGDHNTVSRSASLPTNGAQLGSSIWLIAHIYVHTHTHSP